MNHYNLITYLSILELVSGCDEIIFKQVSYQLCCSIFQSLVDMAPKYILEHFLEAELLVNITEHAVCIDFLVVIGYFGAMAKFHNN